MHPSIGLIELCRSAALRHHRAHGAELYERLIDQYSVKADGQHYNDVLLLVAIVQCIAIDTSICERGFSCMNNLKTARRSQMGDELLRILGAAWKDPTTIPVDAIVDEWRSQSRRGRYEAAMWREAGLEEPGA